MIRLFLLITATTVMIVAALAALSLGTLRQEEWMLGTGFVLVIAALALMREAQHKHEE